MDNPPAANVLGTLGAVCWSIQLIPQIVVNYRRHHATGLQPSMMMLWAWAGVPLGVYNIAQNFNIALCVQPQILTVLSLITWMQCRYYQRGWTVAKSIAAFVPLCALMGGIEGALIIALRVAREKHMQWPFTLMAILSALLLGLGVARHYWDIYIHRTVRGISFLFVFIDALGDLFSIVSVMYQKDLDILGLVIYGTELALWIGIFACGGWFNLLPKVKKWLGMHDFSSTSADSVDSERRTSGAASDIEVGTERVMMHNAASSTSISVFRTVAGNLEGMLARSHTI